MKKEHYGRLYYDYLELYSRIKKESKTVEEFNIKMREAREKLLNTKYYDRRTEKETQF